MFDISLKDNYIYIYKDTNPVPFDRPLKDVSIVSAQKGAGLYDVRLNDHLLNDFLNIPFSDFSLDGVPFATQQAFEDWKNENTNDKSGGSGSGPTPPQGTIQSIKAVLDGNVPAGAKVVSLVYRGNGGTLNGSERPNGYAKEFFNPNGEGLDQIDYTVPTSGGGGAASRGIYIDITL